MNSPAPAYVFGPFRLLPLERLLFEGERALRLGSRAMDLLLALLERAGEIVDKHELVAIVWPNAVVDDATLRVHLAALRKVLGDGRDGQRYITTIPGRGYGFLAPLSHTGQAASGASAPEPRHNLPVMLTRMLGRADVSQAMANQLLQLRLLCIVGPGGIGKTTVAVALATRVLRRYADGVCFVDLSPLNEGGLVPLALATALGVAVPAHDPVPALLAYLRQRQMLIVLDNCEHVIGAAAALADDAEQTHLQQLAGHRLHDVAAPHHARQQHRQVMAHLGHGGAGDAGGGRLARARHRCQEAVAAARHGGDVALAVAPVAKHLAQRRQVHPQGGIVDHRIGPDQRQQFMLVDDVAGALEQGQQQVHGAASQPYRAFAFQQPAFKRQ